MFTYSHLSTPIDQWECEKYLSYSIKVSHEYELKLHFDQLYCEILSASRYRNLLSRSSLEPLISLDLVSTKPYCFRARVHFYYSLYIIFSAYPVRSSEEPRCAPSCHDWEIPDRGGRGWGGREWGGGGGLVYIANIYMDYIVHGPGPWKGPFSTIKPSADWAITIRLELCLQTSNFPVPDRKECLGNTQCHRHPTQPTSIVCVSSQTSLPAKYCTDCVL